MIWQAAASKKVAPVVIFHFRVRVSEPDTVSSIIP